MKFCCLFTLRTLLSKLGELVELIAIELWIIIDFFFLLVHLDSAGAALCDQSNPKLKKKTNSALLGCFVGTFHEFWICRQKDGKSSNKAETTCCDVTETTGSAKRIERQITAVAKDHVVAFKTTDLHVYITEPVTSSKVMKKRKGKRKKKGKQVHRWSSSRGWKKTKSFKKK